jgi:hypothetical protein
LIDIFFGSLGTIIKVILSLLLWLITFLFVRNKLEARYIRVIDKILIALIVSMFFTVIASVYRGIPLIVILFNLFLTVAFYPLIYIFFYIRTRDLIFKNFLFYFLLFLIILTDLTSLGIVWDSQGGLLDLPFIGDRLLQIQQDYSEAINLDISASKLLGGQRRGAFFIGGSTSIYPLLSVGCLANVLFFTLFFKKPSLFWAIPSFLIIWIGTFFSLSRTPLLLMSIMCIYGILNIHFSGKSKSLANQSKLLFATFSLALIIPLIQSIIFNYINQGAIERFTNFFSQESDGNIKRYSAWENGLMLFMEPDAWLGYGVGTSSFGGRRLIYSSLLRHHYESSIFSAFSESGPFGLLILLLPYIAIINFSLKTPNTGIFIAWSCLVIINLFTAPINGYAIVFPCFLVLGLCFSLRFYSKKLKKSPS